MHIKWKYLVSYYLQLGLTSRYLKPTFSEWLASGAPAMPCVIFTARHFNLVLFGKERRIAGCICSDGRLRCECPPYPPEFDLFISKWGLNIQIKKKSLDWTLQSGRHYRSLCGNDMARRPAINKTLCNSKTVFICKHSTFFEFSVTRAKLESSERGPAGVILLFRSTVQFRQEKA